jgi:hypothetical protein
VYGAGHALVELLASIGVMQVTAVHASPPGSALFACFALVDQSIGDLFGEKLSA